MHLNTTPIRESLIQLQNHICQTFAAADGGADFSVDAWQHAHGGGGGITRVLEQGAVIEQGGVNFSHVTGKALPPSATALRPELAGCRFEAMGVSIVIHPRNPYVPTSHCNVRVFFAFKPDGSYIWWAGGGFDLTPYYGFVEDCVFWHQQAKASLDPFGKALYPRFKKACDEYFYLKHRHEARGIGGIFFDDFNELPLDQTLQLLQSVGKQYAHAYATIINRRKELTYGEREKAFQCYRRGRYVEFNLVYDRGTLFGLQSGGRTESILMSLPPVTHWRYNWHPEPGTPERVLYTDFLPPREWASGEGA